MAFKEPEVRSERPSPGTVIAVGNRARLNQLDDASREELFAKGMSHVYDGVPPKPQLVALNTDILLDFADGRPHAWNDIQTVRSRFPDVQFVVPPSVIQELAHLAYYGRTARERNLALTTARSLVREWKFVPISFLSVEPGTTPPHSANVGGCLDLLEVECAEQAKRHRTQSSRPGAHRGSTLSQ